MNFISSLHSQCLIHRILSAAIENQIEAAYQSAGTVPRSAADVDRQQYLLCTGIQANLQRICKLIYLDNCSADTYLASTARLLTVGLLRAIELNAISVGSASFPVMPIP